MKVDCATGFQGCPVFGLESQASCECTRKTVSIAPISTELLLSRYRVSSGMLQTAQEKVLGSSLSKLLQY